MYWIITHMEFTGEVKRTRIKSYADWNTIAHEVVSNSNTDTTIDLTRILKIERDTNPPTSE